MANELKSFIIEQLELFLKQVKKCDPEVIKSQINYISLLSKHLPDKLASELDLKLEECRQYVSETGNIS